jgi:quercetin dioxygenase-like cupin family protein
MTLRLKLTSFLMPASLALAACGPPPAAAAPSNGGDAPAATGESAFDPAGTVAKQADAFQFDTITPFLKFAAAYGDRATGAHGKFGIIPAKTASPSHIHHGAYHGVVIQGQMTDGFNHEANPPVLGPGSYWYVPSEVVHITACVSETPCLFYTHSDAKFDFAPAP